MSWWWLSFCDVSKPVGSQFLGVCIVEADGPATAVQEAWDQGCNPGCEVMIQELIDEGVLGHALHRNRLLTKEEAAACDAEIERAAYEAGYKGGTS